MPLTPGTRPWPASTLYQDVLPRPCRKCNPASDPVSSVGLLVVRLFSHTVPLSFIHSPEFRQTISDCFALHVACGYVSGPYCFTHELCEGPSLVTFTLNEW